MSNVSHQTDPFLIGTYNILNPFHAVKWETAEGLNAQGDDNWDEWRQEAIIDNIKDNRLDICALQELSDRTLPQLSAALDTNDLLMTHLYKHFTEEPDGAHGVAIVYNSKRFKRLKDKGVKTSQDKYRYAAMVDFEDLFSGLVYRVASVHLKGYNPYQTDLKVKSEEQQRGDEELKEYMSALLSDHEKVDGIFILGDFNEDSEEMSRREELSRQGMLMCEGFKWTGASQTTETRSVRQIDWIFYRDQNESLHQINALKAPQRLEASDHSLTIVQHECSLDSLTRLMI